MKVCKQPFLYFIYGELAFLVGGIVGGGIGLALHLILGNAVNRDLLYGVTTALVICAALFVLMQRETYEARRFSPAATVLAALPGFLLRWLVVFLSKGNQGILLCGSASLFTDGETVAEVLITLICFDLLVHLPAFLAGGWWGYRRRRRETEALTEGQS